MCSFGDGEQGLEEHGRNAWTSIPRGYDRFSRNRVDTQSPRKHYRFPPHSLVNATQPSRPNVPKLVRTGGALEVVSRSWVFPPFD